MNELSPKTHADVLFLLRDRWGGQANLLAMAGCERSAGLSCGDFVAAVHSLALALEAAELERGSRAAIFAANTPEWLIADLACQLIGVVTVPIDPAASDERLGFVLRNSAARWVFHGTEGERNRLEDLAPSLPSTLRLVALGGTDESGSSLTALQADGARRAADVPLERFRGRLSNDDPSLLVYPPESRAPGLLFRQGAMAASLRGLAAGWPLGTTDRLLSVLPLSMTVERAHVYHALLSGSAVRFVPRGERLRSALRAARPTVMSASAPLLQELHDRLESVLSALPARHRRWCDWALGVGARRVAAARRGFVGPLLGLEYGVARRVLLRRVHRRFGGELERLLALAPLPAGVESFFHAAGIRLYQAWSPLQVAGVATLNRPGGHRPGTVGRPLEGMQVRVDATGSLQCHGEAVAHELWKAPEETVAQIEDGWINTGFAGSVSEDEGYVLLKVRAAMTMIGPLRPLPEAGDPPHR